MHPRPRRRVLAALPALTLGGALLAPSATAGATPAAPAPNAPAPARIDLVLDLSGSMNENDAGGQTRLAAAKQAVTRIIDTAPEQAPLGLRVYGATYPGQDKKQGCADTQQVLPVTPMDKTARADARKQVAGFKAVGFTPIGVSLREAAKDLGPSGERRIILVSDGEDTCAPPPPCDVARELKAQGVDLAVDVIGFRTPSSARSQLKCIADVTGGSYADAGDADSLTANLSTLFRKEWRTYHATGKPVEGSPGGCRDAPLVAPGQYLDKFTGGRDLYYRVKKRPDQRLQVSATAVAEDGYDRGSLIAVAAGPPEEGGKPRDWLREFDQSMGWANIITTGGRSKPGAGEDKPAPDDTGCIVVENSVTKAGDKPMQVELLVGIADKSTRETGARTPQPRTGADAEGGFSFNSATPIGPGTHRQSIAVGEAPFWRVELKAGQKLTVKAGVEVPADFPTSVTTGWGLTVYNAKREAAECNKKAGATELLAGRTGRIERVCGPWQITGEGAGSSDAKGYDVPGTYYIQAQVAEPKKEAKGIVVPISLTVDVSGTPSADTGPVFHFGDDAAQGPAPAGANPTGSQAAAPANDDSPLAKLALPVGIGAAALVLAGAAFYAVKRRRTP
ncbi:MULTISPECIES: vWA domain-containing protein [Streptomyces]|uniref:vWA domain-containing protein n=1 Tax=Streptomyces TaxID=1883 RepID=UPI001673999D|nr:MULTISPECIES: VWA domain-containing protein [Streptomyces]MBD3577559.1 VWA domain-containing protein [Streptomyces sp. KD18]